MQDIIDSVDEGNAAIIDSLVIAARAACAKVCEEISDGYMRSESRHFPEMKTDAQTGASDCEDAIRARGEQ